MDFCNILFIARRIDGDVGSPFALLVIFGEGWYEKFCFLNPFCVIIFGVKDWFTSIDEGINFGLYKCFQGWFISHCWL